MIDLEDYRNLIVNLSQYERREVYNRLKQHDTLNKDKSLKLFEIINGSQDLEAFSIQMLLYGGENNAAFKKLISRSIEKILDAYLLKDSIEINERYDTRAKDIFLLERQMNIAEMLRYRGFFRLSENRLDKIIAQSKYYEHYDILLHALEKRRSWKFSTVGEKKK